MEYTLNNLTLKDFETIASKLSSLLIDGGFIAFFGDLGAGKTTLVKLIAANLGINEIASPTFTVVREHITSDNKPFFHFDAYRLEDEEELSAIGFDDYLMRAEGGIIAMEWSENVFNLLPKNRLDISIVGSGSDMRAITFKAHGEHHLKILQEFSHLC